MSGLFTNPITGRVLELGYNSPFILQDLRFGSSSSSSEPAPEPEIELRVHPTGELIIGGFIIGSILPGYVDFATRSVQVHNVGGATLQLDPATFDVLQTEAATGISIDEAGSAYQLPIAPGAYRLLKLDLVEARPIYAQFDSTLVDVSDGGYADLGTLVRNTNHDHAMHLFNTTGSPVTLGTVDIQGAFFTLQGFPVAGTVIPAGGSVAFTLRANSFSALNWGAAFIKIPHDIEGDEFRITVAAVFVEP